MVLDPHFKIEPLETKWEKSRCAICREPCDPEGYLHSACAIARDNYLNEQRKKFWEEWRNKQKEKTQ